jgi:hypothetical protein
MKPLLTLFALILCITAHSQLFPTLEPHFPRPGLIYVAKSPRLFTPYASVMVGSIRDSDIDVMTCKLSAGVGIRLKPEHDKTARLVFGLNHTETWNGTGAYYMLRRWSCEVGIMVTTGRLSFIAVTDPMFTYGRPNLESRFGVSYRFGRWEKRKGQVKCPAFDVRQQKSTTRQKRLASK